MIYIPSIILAIENDSDRDFMENVYTSLYPLMNKTAYEIVNDPQTAQDLVHDAIEKLIDKIELLRTFEKKVLTSYVITTVSNVSKNYYNKQKCAKNRSCEGYDEDIGGEVSDVSNMPELVFDAIESYQELGMALKKLNPRDRELLYLKYNMELDDQSISNILGINKNSVREYLTRARRRAKKHITKE